MISYCTAKLKFMRGGELRAMQFASHTRGKTPEHCVNKWEWFVLDYARAIPDAEIVELSCYHKKIDPENKDAMIRGNHWRSMSGTTTGQVKHFHDLETSR